MHKANYASRICHSCRPNCEAKYALCCVIHFLPYLRQLHGPIIDLTNCDDRVTAVDGQYQIGIYSVRPIAYGEEITFDYNSVTEVGELQTSGYV